MAEKNKVKIFRAERRRRRVRGNVLGTTARPRLTVARSAKNVYAQIIDDLSRRTLVGVGTGSKMMSGILSEADNKTAAARKVGLKLAELAREHGIEAVVFDRSRYPYHGRIKALAEGAREGGLKF